MPIRYLNGFSLFSPMVSNPLISSFLNSSQILTDKKNYIQLARMVL